MQSISVKINVCEKSLKRHSVKIGQRKDRFNLFVNNVLFPRLSHQRSRIFAGQIPRLTTSYAVTGVSASDHKPNQCGDFK
jgi:hypothetical protein